MIITIDGPTASGKSIISQTLSKKLKFYYLPTGWLYRTVSYLLVKEFGYTDLMLGNPSQQDVEYCLSSDNLKYSYDFEKGGSIFFKDINITSFLKDYKVDHSVALISPLPMVRDLVVETQRRLVKSVSNAVIEGRDSGSVVFPHADYKFYLTASLDVRANRWIKDQKKRGNNFSLEEAKNQIADRDKKDKDRDYCPLVIPDGAIVIDNSDLNIEETVQVIIEKIQ